MKPIIGITMGDPAGIGPEIAVKALSREEIYNECIPVVIGDYEALKDANRFTNLHLSFREITDVSEATGTYMTVDCINLNLLKQGGWEYKKVSPICGNAAFNYVKKAIELALDNKIHAVVTGPISKEAINLAGYHYAGHTEIFAKFTNTKEYAMMLANNLLKVVHVTTHVSLKKVSELITSERVLKVIRLTDDAMKMLAVEKPRIAVAGLNPHSSENGLFGDEEEKYIIPAIEAAKNEGIDVYGPVSPDTVFVKALSGQYDSVVAMYHDQGHIPVKLTGFKMDADTGSFVEVRGINCTLGLPIICTSVDHGTAFEKAGEGVANDESLVDAIMMAVKMAKHKFAMK